MVTARVKITIIIAILILGLILTFILALHISKVAPSLKEKVKIGFSLYPTSALAFIAQDKGFFAKEGLEVEPKFYISGKLALEEMFKGRVDVAMAKDVPIVLASFERNDFSIIASIAYSDSIEKIVARRDRGISKSGDLKGKRIATQKGTSVHYFLHLFLTHYGLHDNDVELSFKEAQELPESLQKGEIDAICIKEPFVSEAKRALGSNAVVFSGKRMLYSSDNVVSLNSFIKTHPQLMEKVIRALIKADEFTRKNPAQAIKIVSARLKVSELTIASAWDSLGLEIRLRQILFISFEDIARWAISKGLTTKTKFPDYIDYIYFDALDKVNPEAITMIH